MKLGEFLLHLGKKGFHPSARLGEPLFSVWVVAFSQTPRDRPIGSFVIRAAFTCEFQTNTSRVVSVHGFVSTRGKTWICKVKTRRRKEQHRVKGLKKDFKLFSVF